MDNYLGRTSVITSRPKPSGRRAPARKGFAIALAVMTSTASLSMAAEDGFEILYVLSAGDACQFPIQVESRGGNRVSKTFHDRFGSPVRVLEAGKGYDLRFTNLSSGSQLTLPGKGSVSVTKPNPDGTSTVESMGHNVLILFPTDVPAGPSTTLYTGRVVYKVDSAGMFTLQRVSGNQTDICAALSN